MNLDSIRGRINDLDSHEMTPRPNWLEVFGGTAEADAMLTMMLDRFPSMDPQSVQDPLASSVRGDHTPVTPENVLIRGVRAPGSYLPERRLQVLDHLGIGTQLVFPNGVGLVAMMMSCSSPETIRWIMSGGDADLSFDPAVVAPSLARINNDWAIRFAAHDPRLRPVGVVCTNDLATATAEARRLIEGGIKVVVIPSAVPPGDLSPGDPALDGFWRLFADAGIAVVLHVGGEFDFARRNEWIRHPNFAFNIPQDVQEVSLDAYSLSTVHLGPQNFLSAMILGGLFERVPELRFGVIELGGHWIGPTAENLDVWAHQFRRKIDLPMPPSEYVKRNIRVTAFHFEPVDVYIERYGMQDVFCFSSDYPHLEGGQTPIESFAAKLERLGPDVVEKFFVTNAEWLLNGTAAPVVV